MNNMRQVAGCFFCFFVEAISKRKLGCPQYQQIIQEIIRIIHFVNCLNERLKWQTFHLMVTLSVSGDESDFSISATQLQSNILDSIFEDTSPAIFKRILYSALSLI